MEGQSTAATPSVVVTGQKTPPVTLPFDAFNVSDLLEICIIFLHMICAIIAFLHLNAAYTIGIRTWLALTIVIFALTMFTLTAVYKRISLAQKARVPTNVDMGQNTLHRLSLSFFFSFIGMIQIVIIYWYLKDTKHDGVSDAVKNVDLIQIIDKGFNNGQLMTFIQLRYQWFLTWVIFTSTFYLRHLIGDLYIRSIVHYKTN
jgi:hypothetical protein